MKIYDEVYYRLDLKPGIQPLFRTVVDGNEETVAWAWERPDGGRSVGFVLLHFHSNWQLPAYRRFAVNATLWSLKLPVPPGGATVDIDPSQLKVNGVLPPLGRPAKRQP